MREKTIINMQKYFQAKANNWQNNFTKLRNLINEENKDDEKKKRLGLLLNTTL